MKISKFLGIQPNYNWFENFVKMVKNFWKIESEFFQRNGSYGWKYAYNGRADSWYRREYSSWFQCGEFIRLLKIISGNKSIYVWFGYFLQRNISIVYLFIRSILSVQDVLGKDNERPKSMRIDGTEIDCSQY